MSEDGTIPAPAKKKEPWTWRDVITTTLYGIATITMLVALGVLLWFIRNDY
jgi:hypothetical protein